MLMGAMHTRYRLKAILLVSPLLFFLLFAYILPLSDILFASVDNSTFSKHMPRTAEALREWDDDQSLPPDALFDTLAEEMKHAYVAHTIGQVANHLNHQISGMRSLLIRTARKISKQDHPAYRQVLIATDKRWGDPSVWRVLKNASQRLSLVNYLAALDLRYDRKGDIVAQDPGKAIYVKIFWRTLWVSVVVAIVCLLLGFPVAYLMASLPLRISNWLMIMVLLPFWTSLLVRTFSWIVLLQSSGVINSLMVWLGVIQDDQRIQMIFNLSGTIIVMSYVLLPFMILPLYSVMKSVSPTMMRVATSLGAHPFKAFFKVYIPQVMPGIGAGSLLVFMLAVGYYITPALVGGQSGQLISNFIVYHIKTSLNWGMASALGAILFLFVLVIYWLYNRLFGLDKMKLM